MIVCDLAPDGALIIRADKRNLDRLLQTISMAVIYGTGVSLSEEENEMTIRIFKEAQHED